MSADKNLGWIESRTISKLGGQGDEKGSVSPMAGGTIDRATGQRGQEEKKKKGGGKKKKKALELRKRVIRTRHT